MTGLELLIIVFVFLVDAMFFLRLRLAAAVEEMDPDFNKESSMLSKIDLVFGFTANNRRMGVSVWVCV